MKVDLYAQQVAGYFDKEDVKYEMDNLKVEHFADSMVAYASKIDANLISIMKDQESATSNLWMGPTTQQIVNRSSVPVLVIQSKDTQKAGLGF